MYKWLWRGSVLLFFSLSWFSSPLEGISSQGWHLLLIFLATILGIMRKPLPMGAISFISMAVLSCTQILPIDDILQGFAKREIWLIFSAFFISRAVIKTGLGMRIAYLFIALFGKRTLTLSYSLVLSEMILGSVIPSATARSGGIFFPLIYSLSSTFKSFPRSLSANRLGKFLILNSFHCSMIISALFLTAMAGNGIVMGLASEVGIELSWAIWFKGAFLPGLCVLLLSPLLIYLLAPPQIKETTQAYELAQKELHKMGPVSFPEWGTLLTLSFMIFFWITGKKWGIDSTTTALLGISLLLCTKVLVWQDLIEEKGAWESLIWFGYLTTLASQLNRLGVAQYVGEQVIQAIGTSSSWPLSFSLLSLIYFYLHYFFAGNIPHISALYIPFLTASLKIGAPPLFSALFLGVSSNLFGGLTHYASGPAPIFFGAGYVSVREWWKVGAIVTFCNLLLWGGIGSLWCRWIGIW